VALSPKRTVWLFSDTWVGKIRNGRRTDATIVNNTVGVQEAGGKPVTYTIARDTSGNPTALITPSDGRGWFWLQDGIVDRNRLLLFLNQVEKTDDKSVFGFRSVGLWLGVVTNADASPEFWRVDQMKMSNTVFSEVRTLVWGAAIQPLGDDLYIFGTDERRRKDSLERRMVVARVPKASVSRLDSWRYYGNGIWDKDFRNASPLAEDVGSDYSVTPFGKGYIAIYTERGLSPRIMGRDERSTMGAMVDTLRSLHVSRDEPRREGIQLWCKSAQWPVVGAGPCR
jgi:hypothetical protein